TATTYPPSLHDALPIYGRADRHEPGTAGGVRPFRTIRGDGHDRSDADQARKRHRLLREDRGAANRESRQRRPARASVAQVSRPRSEEHTSELQSLAYLV